jgi:hypothetical protein
MTSPRKSVAPGVNRAPFSSAFAPEIPATEALVPLSEVAPKADSSGAAGQNPRSTRRPRQESKIQRPGANFPTSAPLNRAGLKKGVFIILTGSIHAKGCQQTAFQILWCKGYSPPGVSVRKTRFESHGRSGCSFFSPTTQAGCCQKLHMQPGRGQTEKGAAYN